MGIIKELRRLFTIRMMAEAPESKKKEVDMAEIDWLEFEKEIRGESTKNPSTAAWKQESVKDRTIRRFKEYPLVPLGCGLTVLALTRGVGHWLMDARANTNNTGMKQQMLMRQRIFWQAFTVAIMVTGCTWGSAFFKPSNPVEPVEAVEGVEAVTEKIHTGV